MVLGDHLQGRAQEPDRGFLTGGEQIGGNPDHVDDLGGRAIGERGRGQPREDIVFGGARRRSSM